MGEILKYDILKIIINAVTRPPLKIKINQWERLHITKRNKGFFSFLNFCQNCFKDFEMFVKRYVTAFPVNIFSFLSLIFVAISQT